MRRIFFRPLVALLTFFIGSTCVLFVDIYPRLEDKFTDALIAVWNTERFKRVSRGCGLNSSTAEYVTLFFGQPIRTSYKTYISQPLAEQALEEALKGASQVIERKPVLIDSEIVGERVMVTLPSGAAIFRTKRESLYSIKASSIWLAADFERYEARK